MDFSVTPHPSDPTTAHINHKLKGTIERALGRLPIASDGPVQAQHGAKGYGTSYNHTGELYQGEIPDPITGELTKTLITCPTPGLIGSVAEFSLDLLNPEIRTNPSFFSKSTTAVRIFLDEAGFPHAGGVLKIRSFVPNGKGMGASTSNVVAATRAANAALNGPHSEMNADELATITVAAEGAADSVMYPSQKPILFAQCEGRVVRAFNGTLPELLVLVFDTDQNGRVETNDLERPVYDHHQIKSFECALELFQKALDLQSVDLIGRVATFSATMSENATQNPLRKPKFDQILNLKDRCGAAGVLVSHSGTIAGLIFDPKINNLSARLLLARIGIHALGFGRAQVFSTAQKGAI